MKDLDALRDDMDELERSKEALLRFLNYLTTSKHCCRSSSVHTRIISCSGVGVKDF